MENPKKQARINAIDAALKKIEIKEHSINPRLNYTIGWNILYIVLSYFLTKGTKTKPGNSFISIPLLCFFIWKIELFTGVTKIPSDFSWG